jgi:hypothetical protein
MEGPCLDLMVCNSGPSMPGSIALSDVIPARRSLCVVDPGVGELGLPGYHDSPSPYVSWRQVENSTE